VRLDPITYRGGKCKSSDYVAEMKAVLKAYAKEKDPKERASLEQRMVALDAIMEGRKK